MKKFYVRWVVATVAVVAVIIGIAAGARSQNYGELRINLVISDSRILLYSGTESGLYIGQKLNVVRSGRVIGVLELVEVRSNYSVARVASKTEPIMDMDLLVPEEADLDRVMESQQQNLQTISPSSSSKSSGPGSVKPITGTDSATANATKDSADSKKSAKKDTAKKDSKKESSSKKSSRSSRSSKDTSGKSKKTSSKRRSSKTDDSSKDKSKNKKDAAKDEDAGKDKKDSGKPAKTANPRDFAFPTDTGFSGLWTIPTSDILDKNRAAFSYFSGKYSSSSSHQKSNYWNTFGVSQSLDLDATSFSLTYGLDKNIEFAYGQTDMSITNSTVTSGYATNVSTTARADVDLKYYGVKFSPKKHLMLDDTTSKRWTYALGAQRITSDMSDGTYVFGILSMQYDKFDAHAGIFYLNMEGAEGDETGTMVGVELPISSRSLLIAEGTLFHAQYTYNFAFRHVLMERAQLMIGVSDATEMQIKELGLSYIY